MKRRDFIRTAALGSMAVGTAGVGSTLFGSCANNARKSQHSGSGLKLSFEPYELQLRHTFTVSSYSRKTTPGVQVRLDYEGFTGYGEASMPPYLGQSVETVCKFLQKVNLSQFKDPFQLENILEYIDSLSPGDSAAKAAVDIALHDLVGKLMGQPWWRIWGLDPAKTPNTTFTIGIDTPEVVRQKTRECADRFRILKVKVGLDNDKEMINTIREITDLPLAVDANQGWKDREQALDEIHWLKEKGVVMVGCMTETSCAVSAAAQLSPAVDFADLDGNLLISNDIYKGIEVIDGKITLSDRPGIGIIPK